MKLILSNYRSDLHRELEIPGNPLLTYDHLRAGAGIPGQPEGDLSTLATWSKTLDAWVWETDQSLWTDIEVVGLD